MEEKNDDFEIRDQPVSKILDIASQIVATSVKIPGNEAPERQGGYLVVRNKISGVPLLIERVGKCPVSNVKRYHNLALEKGERLGNTRLTSGHISSYQSRDTQNDKWGGAILTEDLIISFSGLKELFDEAVVLVLAIRMHWLEIREAEAITEISGNTFVKPLYNKSVSAIEMIL